MQAKVKTNGKVALITGGNSGIGLAAAKELALKGYHLFLACRDSEKTQEAVNSITQSCDGYTPVECLDLDLADFDSVHACANTFLSRGLTLNLLVANAGLGGVKGLTRSGFEVTFGVCHIGHFLLAHLLRSALTEAEGARVVVVSSNAHRYASHIDFDALTRKTSSFWGLKEYAVAKLCNVLFARQLAKELESASVGVYCVHPGVVATDVWRTLPRFVQRFAKRYMLTPHEGARTLLHCALTDSSELMSGGFYIDCALQEPSRLALDSDLALKLWNYSEQATQTTRVERSDLAA